MGRLGRRWAGLLGALLVALVVALQVAGSRLTPFGHPYGFLMAAAWWGLIRWGFRYIAVRLRGR